MPSGAKAIDQDDVVTLSYSGTNLADGVGNVYAGFSKLITVSAATATGGNATAITGTASAADGKSLTLTFDADIKDGLNLDESGFEVLIDGETYAPTDASRSTSANNQLVLTLSADITAITDDHEVIVNYTGNDLVDISDNEFAQFAKVVDVSAATSASYYADGIVSSAVNGDGDTITLTFDEVIGTSVTASDITVKINGISYTAATAARGTDTKTLVVTLPTGAKAIDQDDVVTLSYSGTNLADGVGNVYAGFSKLITVSAATATGGNATAITGTASAADGKSLTLTFDADIKDGLNLDESGFEVLIDGETYAPTDASRSTSANNQLVLTLSADITAITDDHEVIVNYTGNDLVDISDNEFAQFAKVVDVSAATSATYYADGIVSSAVNGDGDTITLTFDEVIGTSVTASDITVKINGISYTAATAARGTDTKTLVVTLPTGAKAIDQDDVVTLSYSGTNLADGVGNVYAGFSKLITVSAATATGGNATAITGTASAADGKSVTLTFDADIKDGLNLDESGFEVLIDGETYAPTDASRSTSANNQLVLTLSADITAITDDHEVIVNYTGNDLVDISDNEFAQFAKVVDVSAATSATYYADGIVSSAVNGDGDTITLTFDEVIGTSVTASDITVKINGISYTAATAARGTDTKTLVVTLPTGAKAIDQDDVVTLSYSGTNLADGVGNVYAGFSKLITVSAATATGGNATAITGTASAADGKSVTLTFDADIKDGLNLDESGFEVLIDGETYAPTDASRSTSANNQLVLTLSADITAITDDHEVIVNYTGNDLVDISDNEFAQFAKVVDVSAATSATYYADGIVSSAVNGDGDTITLTFDEVIGTSVTASDITVKINGISYTAATAARGTDTKTLVVTLPTGAKAIDQDDVVTLSYSGTNLADGVGNVYAGFSKLITVSAATATGGNATAITGTASAADGKSVTLTFDADIKDGLNLDESGFEVLIDGETYAPTDASRSTSANNQLVLTLSADITAITDDHEVIVNYTGNDLVDISDNEFAQFAKVVDVSAATSATYYADGIVSSAVNGDGDTITLTFDEVIGTSVTASDITVKINGISYTAATAARGTDTKTLVVTLPTGAKAIDQDDVVTLSYSGTNLADGVGNVYAGFLEVDHCQRGNSDGRQCNGDYGNGISGRW